VTIRVALISASIATVLGTLAAVSLVRFTRFNGRTLFTGMVYAPLGDAGSDHRPVAAAAVRRHRLSAAVSGP
jgi:hypothetical protein